MAVCSISEGQVEYPALKAQFQQKWPGIKPQTRQVVLKCGRDTSLSILSKLKNTIYLGNLVLFIMKLVSETSNLNNLVRFEVKV